MIIIPAERSVDWRHPPWVTLILIILNSLVFFVYQSGDIQLLDNATSEYKKANLLRIEATRYVNYLEREAILHGHSDMADVIEVKEAIKHKEYNWVAQRILLDRGFYNMLQDEGSVIWSHQEFQDWKAKREPIVDNWINQMSYIRFGLIPSEFHISSLISYQFLHGGIGHLIGNMVFLFLLGFTVERALGGGRYLLSYVACGMFSGAFFTLVELGSLTPLVGASGAISGLMGMYVVLFGLQKIRFFYYLGFFFNYFMAPAILLLPIWIGKEVFSYFTGQGDGVAYMAHAGGLIAGAGLMAGLRKSILQVKEEFYDSTEDEKDQLFRKMYSSALNAVSRMEFDVARGRFEKLWAHHPDRPGMLQHLYHLEKLSPEREAFHNTAINLLNVALKRNYFELLMDTYTDYLKRSGEDCKVDAILYNKILFACLRHHEVALAERVFERLKQQDAHEMIEEACQVFIQEFGKRQDRRKVEQYRKILQLMTN